MKDTPRVKRYHQTRRLLKGASLSRGNFPTSLERI
jgi:hypothetical protein